METPNQTWPFLRYKNTSFEMLHLGYFFIRLRDLDPDTVKEKKITAFEMCIYRRISRTSWTNKVTNQHVLQKINIKSTELVQMIRTRKAKFYGHVRRHESLQRVILEGKVEGKRGRGRKRKSWTDNIKTHLGLPINTCAEVARRDTQPRKREGTWMMMIGVKVAEV